MRPDFARGAIDLHIHSAPDVIDRLADSIDIATAAADAGMRAIVLKDHAYPSFLKAVLTDRVVPGVRVFGGITLNATVGGLSLRTVKGAIAGGARVVMFPTCDTAMTVKRQESGNLPPSPMSAHGFGLPFVALRTVDDHGKVTPEVDDILRFIADHPDVIVSNGHLPEDEAVPLFERAAELGIRKLVIEHPNSHPAFFSPESLRTLVDLGATMNLSPNAYNPVMLKRKFSEVVEFIATYGADHCALITDGGQPFNPMPPITLNTFCAMLNKEGVSTDDIHLMTQVVPAKLLDIDLSAESDGDTDQ